MEIRSNVTLNDLVPYSIFPNSFIRNGKLSPQQKILFEIFCSYDHIGVDGTRKGWCEVSLDTIAQQMGLVKTSVQVHLKKLVELGMIVVVYRNNDPNFNKSKTSIYILNILPGISESDKKRIIASRNIEIKNQISGLNTIKIQTPKGFQYVSSEDFDLAFLVSGERSNDVVEVSGVVTPEEIISKEDEAKVTDEQLYKHQPKVESIKIDDDLTITMGRKISPGKKTDWNNINTINRISAGNYKDIKVGDICTYFKKIYEEVYNGQIYFIYTNDQKHIKEILEKVNVDLLIPLIEHFIKNYEKLRCYKPEYPKPNIWALTQEWILNLVSNDYFKQEKITEQVEAKRSWTRAEFDAMETLDI